MSLPPPPPPPPPAPRQPPLPDRPVNLKPRHGVPPPRQLPLPDRPVNFKPRHAVPPPPPPQTHTAHAPKSKGALPSQPVPPPPLLGTTEALKQVRFQRDLDEVLDRPVRHVKLHSPPPPRNHLTTNEARQQEGDTQTVVIVQPPHKATPYQGLPKKAWAEQTTSITVEDNETLVATPSPRREHTTGATTAYRTGAPIIIVKPTQKVSRIPKPLPPPSRGKMPLVQTQAESLPASRNNMEETPHSVKMPVPAPPPPPPVRTLPSRRQTDSPAKTHRQIPQPPGGTIPLTPSTAPPTPPPPPPVSSIPAKRLESSQQTKTSRKPFNSDAIGENRGVNKQQMHAGAGRKELPRDARPQPCTSRDENFSEKHIRASRPQSRREIVNDERVKAEYTYGVNISQDRPTAAAEGRKLKESAHGMRRGGPFRGGGRGRARAMGAGREVRRGRPPTRLAQQPKMSHSDYSEESEHSPNSAYSKSRSSSPPRRRHPHSSPQGALRLHSRSGDVDRLTTIRETAGPSLNEDEEGTGIFKRITRTVSGNMEKMREVLSGSNVKQIIFP